MNRPWRNDWRRRFTLRDLPFTAVTVFANYFQFTIPAGDEPLLDLGDVEHPLIEPPLTLENYPPSATPYRFGSFWLVHTPDGQLMAFSPVSPEYDDRVSVEECQFAWEEANQRFVDPCSGDEWELNGRLNLEQSSELWSNRNLDQFFVHVTDVQIFVQLDRLYQSLPANEPPVTSDSQFGVTMTVKTAEFTPTTTSLTTLTQVDPIWGMDPEAFPPQQALTYVTFPNSLVDDQGRFYEPIGGQGGLPVTDADTNGLQQEYNTQWQPTADDAQTVTVNFDHRAQQPLSPNCLPARVGKSSRRGCLGSGHAAGNWLRYCPRDAVGMVGHGGRRPYPPAPHRGR